MNSSDSMNGNEFYNRSPTSQEMPSSTAAESTSDSGNTEKISTPPSIIQQKKSSSTRNRNNISTPSKPSTSVKRPREHQAKEASKPSSKKSKKPAQEDNKGKAAGAPEAEKSGKKNGPIWNSKDEAAFLKRLVACCEEGKGLPKNSGSFYEAVRKDLDGDYSYDQLYNKMKGLKAKFVVARDKIKDKGLVGFKNAHGENLYRMSKQVWGNMEREEDVGTEKASKGVDARVEKKKKNVVVDPGREREEVKRNKNGDVDMALNEQEGEEEEDEDESDGEEGERHGQGEQNFNVNSSQHDNGMANGSPRVVMSDQQQMFDQLRDESLGIYSSQLMDMLDGYKNEIANFVNIADKEYANEVVNIVKMVKNEVVNIVNMTKKELQGSSNTARATGWL